MSSRLRSFAVINHPNTGARPDPSVAIDLADIDRGFLPNRLTTDQRDAIDSPPEGLTIYNTDTQTHEIFTGAAWQQMTKGGSTQYLQVANNLSDVADVATSRTHLGLGDAATHPATDFDAAGAAATAQAASLQKSANLSDLTDTAAARTNLGVVSGPPISFISNDHTFVFSGGGTVIIRPDTADISITDASQTFAISISATSIRISLPLTDPLIRTALWVDPAADYVVKQSQG